MKTRQNNYFNTILYLVSILCVLCASVVNSPAQDYKTLKPGIEYAEVTKEISGLKVNMNLLRLDLTKVRLDVHHAMDAAIGTEKTSSIATRHGAFAAINAGFFRLDKSPFLGDPAELLFIDGKLLSDSNNRRVALTIFNKRRHTEADIGEYKVGVALFNGKDFVSSILTINRERKPGDVVVYTPEFGPTTLTDEKGVEILVHNKPPAKSNSVIEIRNPGGNSPIPKDGFVISMTSAVSLDAEIVHALTYRPRRIAFAPLFGASDKAIPRGQLEDVIAGVPQLIKNSKIDITWQEEKSSKSFVETRHPRTAVAKLKDGKFLMITVDGRTESSGGIGLQDLAEYLLSLGATDAMNLDGGGSTTMFVDGKVVNHPSDKEGERKVSDAILVTPRKK